MVFYTCSGCGESLKKNKVENHCYTCYNCEYLTCIDCNQDFYGDDYKFHTSCMTENEKYSAKGTEFKPNKGELKQQQWLQNIEIVMSSGRNFSDRARSLIKTLSNYDNIPRKRGKFLNFLKNSLRVYDTPLGEEIYEAFSAANKTKSISENEGAPAISDADKTQNGALNEISNDLQKNDKVEQNENKVKKKSKNCKIDAEDNRDSSEISSKKYKTLNVEKSEKPRKKKRKHLEVSVGDEIPMQDVAVENTLEMTEKPRKKKRKHLEVLSQAETQDVDENSETTEEQKKRGGKVKENSKIQDNGHKNNKNHEKSAGHHLDLMPQEVTKKKKKRSSKLDVSSNIETASSVGDSLNQQKHDSKNVQEIVNKPKKRKKSKKNKDRVE